MTQLDVYGPEGAATVTGPEAPRVRRRKPWTTRRVIAWGVVAVAVIAFVLWARAKVAGISEDTQAANPIVRWEWLFKRDSTPAELREALSEHLKLTIIPVGLGLVIASVLSALAIRFRWTFTPITAIAGFLYTIPSVALFGALGSRYTYFTAAVVALTSYTLLILIRNIVAGIDSVPPAVTDAADGLGLSRSRRLLSVELPLALPVIIAGLRVAMVTTIGLVAITGVIQLGGFGALVLDGYQSEFYTKIAVGSVASILLAVAFDLGLNRLEIVLTPWLRKQAGVIASVLAAAGDPGNVVEWFQDGENRALSGPIFEQLLITLQHALTALVIAVAIAVPLAVVLAHYRRGEVAAAAVINVGRAVPTVAILGILVLVFLAAGQGFSSGPIVLALVLLALPPLFTNSYAAVRGVDPGAVSAARAMGFDERELMARVELPLAMPVILTGVRIAAVQVIATEPLVAFFGGDGLGVYLRQGLGNQDFLQVQAGALLVTATAIGVDLLLYLAGRAVLPRGVQRSATGRAARRASRPSPIPR